jgi:protein TonB
MLHYYILPSGSDAAETARKHVNDFAIDFGQPTGAPASPAQEAQALVAPVQADIASVSAGKLVRAVALGLALMAHAAVLYVLAREPDEAMAGGGGRQIDAISVTIVSSNVLESREVDRAQPSAPAAADTVEATDGTPDSAPATAAEQREEKKEKEEPREEKKREEEPVRTTEAIFEVPKEAQPQRKQEAAAPAAGGAAARSDTPAPANASGLAAASAGAVREYARYVSQALSKTRPKGAGGLGTVRIKFVIATDGSLASAEIAKSSGSTKLDTTALEAVRHARFPAPPPGTTVAQLTYEVPYYFR